MCITLTLDHSKININENGSKIHFAAEQIDKSIRLRLHD